MKDERESGVVKAATYRFVVGGELDARFAHLFNGMQLSHVEETTVLVGSVRDAAQLHGLVEQITELGLELLLVERLVAEDKAEKGPNRHE
jgi:hypothetical protein